MTVYMLDELKQRARTTWAAGDYDAIAQQIWGVGERLVAQAGVRPGDEVLDVACGTGNATIRAAHAGGRVVGLDLTPELLATARARADAAALDIAWVEGDAVELPFDDESFDVVLSCFGCLWVPRHAVTARELARVLRPGGRLGLTNWTPEGGFGAFAQMVGRHLPPPPDVADPPPLWGDEAHVRELFAGTGIELQFVKEWMVWRYASVAEAVERFETQLGPVVKAREALEQTGAWPALRADIVEWVTTHDIGDDDAFVMPQEYLVTLGRRDG
jgi:ubiquinone/menaquinone biosynthesis C-methylase UbiE